MTYIANEKTFTHLKSFDSVADMDAAVNDHRRHQATELTPTMRDLLDVIKQYSCKYPGLSFVCKNKLASMVGRSRRTIIRLCNDLERMGIIAQYRMKREHGDRRQTSNAIVIMPFKPMDDIPEMSHQETPVKSADNKSHIETIPTDFENDTSHLKKSIPDVLYHGLAPYFGASALYDAVGVCYRAKARIAAEITFEQFASEYAETIRACVMKLKRGRIRNFNSYLFAAIESTTALICRQIAFTGDITV